MDLFVNFGDAQKQGVINVAYEVEKQVLKITFGFYPEGAINVEIHDVEDGKIINENVILKGYKLFKDGDMRYIFKRSDDKDDSIYLLILNEQHAETMPFYKPMTNQGKFEVLSHIDCSTYHGLWFVNKSFIVELKDPFTFGMATAYVNERLEKIAMVTEAEIKYFYEFIKTASDDASASINWNFRKIENESKSDELYIPIDGRM